MDFVVDNILLIYVLPLVLAVFCFVLHFIKIVIPQQIFSFLSTLSAVVQLLFAVILFGLCNFSTFEIPDLSVEWFRISDSAMFLGAYIDKISSFLLLIFTVMFISVLWHSFSDKRYSPNTSLFYACINMIDFLIIALVLSSNLIQSSICLALTGIFSYLLINIDFINYNISKISRKFVLQNRIADTLIFLGITILIYFVLNYPISEGRELLAFADFHEIAADFYIYLSDECFMLTCILFILGFALKTAQFPFHSAYAKLSKSSQTLMPLVILTAMITVGIYLSVRLLPLFALSESVMHFIIYFGALSALVCAVFASANNKPRRIIAYAFVSQTASAFALLGFSAVSPALLFFENSIISLAILYLISILYTENENNTNSVITCLSTGKHPLVFLSALIAVFGQIGVFFGGFLADNSVFQTVFDSRNLIFTISFVLTALLTSYYLFRLLFILFSAKEYENGVNTPNPSKILSILLLTVLFVGVSTLTFFAGYYSSMFDFKNLSTSLYFFLLLIFGLLFGYLSIYKIESAKSKGTKIGIFFRNGMFIDKLFEFLSDNIFDLFANLAKNIDKYVINAVFNSFGHVTKFLSYCVTLSQNGNIQSYIAYGISVMCVLLIIYVLVAIGIGGLF